MGGSGSDCYLAYYILVSLDILLRSDPVVGEAGN